MEHKFFNIAENGHFFLFFTETKYFMKYFKKISSNFKILVIL